MNPYVIYMIGAALSVTIAGVLAGVWGVVALCFISFHALFQLMLSDYVQHYGLRRGVLSDGKIEPMGPSHSWNAPHPYSAALMMNAPRHSDHHMHPTRDFSSLAHCRDTMPTLPHSLPVTGALALVPSLWMRTMDPRVRQWVENPEREPSTPAFSSPWQESGCAPGGSRW